MILAIFPLMCFIYQINGESNVMSDHTSHNSSDHSASESGNIINVTFHAVNPEILLFMNCRCSPK